MALDPNIPMAGRTLDTATPIYQAQQMANQNQDQANQNAMATEKVLQEHYQALDAREQSRLRSTIVGAVRLKQFLDRGDVQGAQNFLSQRRSMLHQRIASGENVDTQETDYALQALQSGNVEELQNGINGLIAAGQVYGIIDRGGSNDPAAVREWQYYNQLNPQDQQRYLNMKRSNQTLNLGGSQMVVGPSGQPVAQYEVSLKPENLPENVEARNAAMVQGKASGEAADKLASLKSQLPRLQQVVANLGELSKSATYTMVGQAVNEAYRQMGVAVPKGAVDRTTYEAIINNEILPLLRDTFGAQFTEREGESLKKTLGDVNKSPSEKQAVLEAFISQKTGQIEALQRRADQTAPAGIKLDANSADTGSIKFLGFE